MGSEISERITALRSRLDRVLGRRDGVKQSLSGIHTDIRRLEIDDVILGKISELFRQIIDQEVTAGVQAVERLQTEGLQAVFPDQDLRVKATVEVTRGRVSVDLVTIQKDLDGSEIEGPVEDAFGGAVATVQSVLLRVILMLRRGLHPVMFLDETLPALDDAYTINTGKFLSTLCRRLGVDILLVTHNPVLVEIADKAYRIVKKGGVAGFEKAGRQRSGP